MTSFQMHSKNKQKQEKKMTNRKFVDGFELRTELAKLMPNYKIGVDGDGQLVIYTNLIETTFDNYVEMESK